ncbi:LETM1 domain-containing protein 1 isoform X2 [Onthophagus taurus]|uniref:LETM1 domain-containing protein 1 isoform X2 n=1 Tax=Onthophagus taurus TaxID=166361 RepID=UPI000C209FCD|nr:LETM1 domain-containing protein 1 isoform X2 [Onthophagus taurus]
MSVRIFTGRSYTRIRSFCRNSTASKPYRKPLYKRDEAKKLRFYIADRYVTLLTKYETMLEKRFPSAMRVYRRFMDGIKDFYYDTKEYLRIVRYLNFKDKGLKDLSRQEIELYQKIPKDMIKIAPFLMVSILPFANYVVFPIAYLFPRQVLCSHFWNIQQRNEFGIMEIHKRLLHNRPVFRHLQAAVPCLENHELKDKWKGILASLGSGSHPNPTEILACKNLFMEKPFHIFYLNRSHVKHLLQMHNMHRMWFRKSRLSERAIILQALDRAIVREGGVMKLSTDALRYSCVLRGLNPMNLSNQEMQTWLSNWIWISNHVDKNSLSLLLHCPILLGYNHPNNWRLIYAKK